MKTRNISCFGSDVRRKIFNQAELFFNNAVTGRYF